MPGRDSNPEQRLKLIFKCGEVFSPAAPVSQRDLFAGRIQQLARVIDVANTRGQHAAIYGERGVGKTSLANIAKEILGDSQRNSRRIAVKVNCSSVDNYDTMWKKALGEVFLDQDSGQATIHFLPEAITERKTARDFLRNNASPGDIRRIVEALGDLTIIFDEFDRLQSQDATALFADTMKEFSDAAITSTIIVVGVAHSIDDLITEHGSIDRALCQVLMPRMTADELKEIVTKALPQLGMTIDEEARSLIILLSQGLPHYTHLLGKAACRAAILHDRFNVSASDVKSGITMSLEDTQQSVQTAYQQATASPRKDTLFKEVLLACALAPVDDLGYFASADVREPLSTIMGKRYDIPGFSQHLDKFSSDVRGNVLEKAGTQRRFRFRFRNPLLQPYVIMRGLAGEMIAGNALELLLNKNRRME